MSTALEVSAAILTSSRFRTTEDVVDGWHRVIIIRAVPIAGRINRWMLKDKSLDVARQKAAEFLKALEATVKP